MHKKINKKAIGFCNGENYNRAKNLQWRHGLLQMNGKVWRFDKKIPRFMVRVNWQDHNRNEILPWDVPISRNTWRSQWPRSSGHCMGRGNYQLFWDSTKTSRKAQKIMKKEYRRMPELHGNLGRKGTRQRRMERIILSLTTWREN